jgi:aryl-phospho-beta-D-glucosidase BglC (GH1 family)
MKNYLTLSILLLAFTASTFSQQTAKDAVVSMGRGINIGNTMDPPTGEGTWTPGPVQEYYFDDIKNEGFDHVRLPITWDHYTSTVGPDYVIEPNWLTRVEEVVDWALEIDLYIVINAHHETWLKTNITTENKARFYKIWEQIATHFKDHSEKLIFEILNEPNVTNLAFVNEINDSVLKIIRLDNPTRNVIYQGDNTCTHEDLKEIDIPDVNDTHLIGGFHEYFPFNFCYYRPLTNPNNTPTWGTTSDIAALKNMYLDIASWSISNNIPIYLGEFGCDLRKDSDDRLDLFRENMKYLDQYSIAAAIWCNDRFADEAAGETQEAFGIYDRENRVFDTATYVLLNKTTGVDEVELQKDMNLVVFPNPATDIINVTFPAISTFNVVQIYNSNGQLVIQRSIFGSQSLLIDVSKLGSGLYPINAIGETKTIQNMLIKL